MRQKFLTIFAVAAVVLLLIAGCSKQTPATEPVKSVATATTPAPQPVAAPAQATPAAVVQEAPATTAIPPELTRADETVKDLDTSELDQIGKDVDALAVP